MGTTFEVYVETGLGKWKVSTFTMIDKTIVGDGDTRDEAIEDLKRQLNDFKEEGRLMFNKDRFDAEAGKFPTATTDEIKL